PGVLFEVVQRRGRWLIATIVWMLRLGGEREADVYGRARWNLPVGNKSVFVNLSHDGGVKRATATQAVNASIAGILPFDSCNDLNHADAVEFLDVVLNGTAYKWIGANGERYKNH